MDGQPVRESKRMLLTLVGKVENQGMVWNADRTSVGNQWGHGPTMAEGIPATVSVLAPVAHVYALDGTGNRGPELTLTTPANRAADRQFTVGPQHKTLWYEITR
jgi:hypothetical protein